MYAYLLSTLPAFGIDGPPPMPVSELLERCLGFVAHDELAALADPEAAAAAPGGGPATAVARAWLDGERQLAVALARRRAPFWGLVPGDVEREQRPDGWSDYRGFRVSVEDGVARAYDALDPLARQHQLDTLRWALLEELAGPVPWGFAALFSYAQRLRIAWQWAQRDAAAGREILSRVLDAIEGRPMEPAGETPPVEEHHG